MEEQVQQAGRHENKTVKVNTISSFFVIIHSKPTLF